MSNPKFTIILPSFEDKRSTLTILNKISDLHLDAHIILVEDGSLIDPILIEDLKSVSSLEGILVTLKQNVGHQRALTIGVLHSLEHYPDKKIVLMDSDGEDKPESISVLIDELERSQLDIVVAQRTTRDANIKFKIFYQIYKFIYKILSGMRLDFGNFSAMTPKAARRLTSMPEIWIHIGSTILISRLRVSRVPTPRGSRYFGTGKYSLNLLVQHGLRSLIVISDFIISRIMLFCFSIVILMSGLLLTSMLVTSQIIDGFVNSNLFAIFYISLIFNPLILLFFIGTIRFGHLEIKSNYLQYLDTEQKFNS